MDDSTVIFELADVTSEEVWYPLGLWSSLDGAMAALSQCKEPADFDSPWEYEDYFCVEIRKRRFGWDGQGKTVYRQTWHQRYNEEKDEYFWEAESDFL